MKPPSSFKTFALSTLFALLAACSSVPSGPEEAARGSALQTVPSEALNPDVRQETIRQTICVPGYAASVRPSTTYTSGVKAKLLRERDLPPTAAGHYELDHRIPLALGGHPRNLRNLELQPWDGAESARLKDRLERRLQVLVCKEQLRLDTAQRAIFNDWQEAYQTFVARSSSTERAKRLGQTP
jgi:hypothetical protein